jgi:hypothetical protein
MTDRKELIPVGLIESRIFSIRGQEVTLSTHLGVGAWLYCPLRI